jgi:hypothetical protein
VQGDKQAFGVARAAKRFHGRGILGKLNLLKPGIKALVSGLAAAAIVTLLQGDLAIAATKSQRCQAYAHNVARSTPRRGGPVRGALVGAGIGSFSGNAGAGAAIGAGVGLTRRVVQRGRSYNYYYNRCMARR